MPIYEISTHTLTWSVTIIIRLFADSLCDFNSHAHVERDDKINTDRYCYQNFNSHAHVERDTAAETYQAPMVISTHTLTWSVTNGRRERPWARYISTHTLTWSVTPQSVAEGDYHGISTHTLTWSVTLVIGFNRLMKYNFNSHAHVERDQPFSLSTIEFIIFQLTRSRGA